MSSETTPQNGQLSLGDASQATDSTQPPAAAEKKKRTRKTPEDVIAEEKKRTEEAMAKLKSESEARLAKKLQQMVPLSKRKTDALELLTKLRATVAKHGDNDKLADGDLDALIVRAVAQAYPEPETPAAAAGSAEKAAAAATA